MIKKLKYYISFFYDFPVEKIPSKHSGKLEIAYYKGEYRLNTERVIYSHGKQYEPFSVSFEKLKIENRKINSVLILGLGLGSVPVLLNERGLNCKAVCVELDKGVIALCEKYLDKSIFKNLDIICADAEAYVENCKEQFDLIISDIFIDNQIPRKFQTENYLDQLDKLLAKNGMLMVNRLMTTDALKKESRNYFEKIFSKKFTEGFSVPSKSNLVLVYENN